MPDQMRIFGRDLQEISHLARQTLGQLGGADLRPAPEKYLAAVLNVRALREMWAQHIRSEQVLFTEIASRDRHIAAYLIRIGVENEEIEEQLASLSTAPWPRSPEAGLHSMRTRATKVLSHLIEQIERERVTILPLIRRWLPAETGTVKSELVAI